MPLLLQINQIKKYKSYADFKWDSFSTYKKKDDFDEQTVCFDHHFNVLFGENGSGKSCISDILKSISGIRNFKSPPNKIKLSFKDDSVISFNGDTWERTFETGDFKFFDSEFVSKNIHTHGDRDGTAGGHKQNAGKLILSVSAKYNELKEKVQTTKKDWQSQKECPLTSEPDLTDEQKSLYDGLLELDLKEKAKRKSEFEEKHSSEKTKLAITRKNREKSSEIQNIKLPNLIVRDFDISPSDDYSQVFNDIIDVTHENVKEELLNRVADNRDFFDKGTELSGDGTVCPFCEQEYGEEATKLIESYKSIFDKTYQDKKKKRIKEIDSLLDELENLKNVEKFLIEEIQSRISDYSKLSAEYGIDGFDKSYEDEIYKTAKIPTNEIDNLVDSLKKIKNGEKVLFSEEEYISGKSVANSVKSAIRVINLRIRLCKWEIIRFKEKHSCAENIDEEIEKTEKELTEIEFKLKCLDTEWVKKQEEIKEAKEKLSELDKAKKDAKTEYDEYCAKIPKKITERIQDLVNNQFDFKFKLIPSTPAPNTNEYPFDFEVVDENGKTRDFADGLSEGERQVISLCFFFVTLPENLNNKIVVFDDPITSLDSRNLKKLVELIGKYCSQSQTFILTHHPLFYKYLSKNLNSCYKFGILRNKDSFGGSFIYPENRRLTILERLKGIPEQMQESILKGSMDSEAFTLENGHLLRYAVEKFVKDGLQGWSTNEFDQRVRKFKDKPALTDPQYNALKSIYDFCNWSNSLHPDKEDTAALNELLMHINNFIEIAEPYKELWV